MMQTKFDIWQNQPQVRIREILVNPQYACAARVTVVVLCVCVCVNCYSHTTGYILRGLQAISTASVLQVLKN